MTATDIPEGKLEFTSNIDYGEREKPKRAIIAHPLVWL